MTGVDALALAFVALAALVGLGRGLIASALSAAALVAGAIAGGRLAPHLLPGGDESPYTPVVALGGAVLGALLLEGWGTLVGRALRGALARGPLRALDSGGGLVFGAVAGFVIVWVVGAVALHVPGQTELRQEVQRSFVLTRLNEVVPPARLIDAIQRVDPLPSIAGPAAPLEPPDPALLRRPGVRRAAPSVVRILGTACGLSVSGSGWIARPGLVVTAAHVVAGQDDTTVEEPGGDGRLRAEAVAFDPRQDVAVLRVTGLRGRPLPLGDARPGEAVAILGYPEAGPFDAVPGRIGRTAAVVSRDAYGNGPITRTVTSVSGRVRHGNSGGPAVNGLGEVETTVFASRVGAPGGFGVPPAIVRQALARARGPVSTGDCAA